MAVMVMSFYFIESNIIHDRQTQATPGFPFPVELNIIKEEHFKEF